MRKYRKWTVGPGMDERGETEAVGSPPGAVLPPGPVPGAEVESRPGHPRPGFRSVLANRRYLLFEASVITATTGYSVYAVSIPWLAFENSGSLLVVGLVLFVELGVYALTFLVAPLVDRIADKRTILVVGFPVQAVAAVILAVAAARGELQLPLLLGLVGVLAVVWDFEWAVFQVAPRLLLTKDELFAAGGISSAFGGGATIGGYAAGAGFILLAGPATSGYLYAGLLLAAVGLASVVPLRGPRSEERSYLGGFREGWAYLTSAEGRPLLQLGVLDAVVGFFSTAPPVLVTVFADRSFPDPGLAYGILFTSFVIGGVAVDLTLGYFNPRRRVGLVLVGGLLGGAVALALVGHAPPSLVGTAAVWVLAGGALGAYSSGKVTFEWGFIPRDRLARVTSNLYTFPGVSGAVGAVVLGFLASRLSGLAVAEIVAGVLGAAVVLAVALPAVRRFSF
ncbi:MAG TPA: hypothetical protein VMI55_05190 [Thermoplasmata archaeon]|nr:hypothetical protein [Thermoplasmata archaeon]